MNNPLQKYMRTETMYITLPSKGYYYDETVIETTKNGELGIMPMTALDEISLNTPDALLNGEGIRKAIMSCVPGIKNANKLLMPDFDMLLLAIRKASYGDILQFNTLCPKCKKENKFRASISNMIEMSKPIETPIFIDINKELRVYVRPHSFECVTYLALQALETGKVMRAIQEQTDDLDEDIFEKLKSDYSGSIQKLAELNFNTLLDGIEYVKLKEGGEIDNPDFIKEWLFELDGKKVKAIKKKIDDIEGGVNRSIIVICDDEECKHEWEAEVEFNPSDFFGQGS